MTFLALDPELSVVNIQNLDAIDSQGSWLAIVTFPSNAFALRAR
jgi:hypothetical protein